LILISVDVSGPARSQYPGAQGMASLEPSPRHGISVLTRWMLPPPSA
jgi:hypothetical protein